MTIVIRHLTKLPSWAVVTNHNQVHGNLDFTEVKSEIGGRRKKIIIIKQYLALKKCTFSAQINLCFTSPTVFVRYSWHVENCIAPSH